MKLQNLSLALLVFGSANALFAVSIVCPTATRTPPNAGNTAYLGASGGCNELITFNSNGSITTTIENANPYDGSDDNLVGVVNNTGAPILSIFLIAPDDGNGGLFGFDDDGVCAAAFTLSPPTACNFGTFGYEGGVGVSFTIDPGTACVSHGTCFLSGTVNFGGGGVPGSGGTNFFSLEQAPNLNLSVNGTPEPASLVLIGTGLTGLYFIRRRRKA